MDSIILNTSNSNHLNTTYMENQTQNFPKYGKMIKLKNKWRGWIYGKIVEKYLVSSRVIYTVDFINQYSNFFKEELEIIN